MNVREPASISRPRKINGMFGFCGVIRTPDVSVFLGEDSGLYPPGRTQTQGPTVIPQPSRTPAQLQRKASSGLIQTLGRCGPTRTAFVWLTCGTLPGLSVMLGSVNPQTGEKLRPAVLELTTGN